MLFNLQSMATMVLLVAASAAPSPEPSPVDSTEFALALEGRDVSLLDKRSDFQWRFCKSFRATDEPYTVVWQPQMITTVAIITLTQVILSPQMALPRKPSSSSARHALLDKTMWSNLCILCSGQGTVGDCYSAPTGVNWNRVEIDIFYSSGGGRKCSAFTLPPILQPTF